MINDFVKCDKLVYLNDSNSEELIVRDYNTNIKEEVKNENLMELIQTKLYNYRVDLKAIKQKYAESKDQFKSKVSIMAFLLSLTALIDVILFTGKDLLGILLGLGFSSIFLISLVIIYIKNPYFSKAKKVNQIIENLNTKIEYLSKELSKVKAKQDKLNFADLSLETFGNYRYSLKSYNEEQKALLNYKLALIDQYLANKNIYQNKDNLTNLSQNPEEEQLIRELIKKEQ